MHPKYWGRTFIMGDVALLQLHSPVIISKYVQPICLPEPNYSLKVGTQCWVTGWGQVKQRFSGKEEGVGGEVCTPEGTLHSVEVLPAEPLHGASHEVVSSDPWFFGCVRIAPHMRSVVMVYTIALAVGPSFRPRKARSFASFRSLELGIHKFIHLFVHLTNVNVQASATCQTLGTEDVCPCLLGTRN